MVAFTHRAAQRSNVQRSVCMNGPLRFQLWKQPASKCKHVFHRSRVRCCHLSCTYREGHIGHIRIICADLRFRACLMIRLADGKSVYGWLIDRV